MQMILVPRYALMEKTGVDLSLTVSPESGPGTAS